MQRVITIQENALQASDKVTLDLEARRKRRHVIETKTGERVLIDLPEVPHLKHGNGLELEDGRVIEVHAEPEELIEITTSDPVRIAWHLGNRHLPTQIVGRKMRIRVDHVIEHMLEGLGCSLTKITVPFDPEGGAYGGHHHAHD